MRLLTKLSEKLRGPGPERTVISQPLIVPQKNSLEPIATQKDIEFLRALKQIYIREPLKSFSLKLYAGQFDESLDRVTCQHCIARRCRDYEPRLIVVHHARKELELFGCSACKGSLIRIERSS